MSGRAQAEIPGVFKEQTPHGSQGLVLGLLDGENLVSGNIV
jgi:hypothetical protein